MMIHRLSTGFATLGCVLLASCYPVNENPRQKKVTKTPDKIATNPDPLTLKEQDALRKKKEQDERAQEKTAANPDSTTPPIEKPKGQSETKHEYPYGIKVPGKENVVLSPYNKKLVSVLDDKDNPIPSGTLVTDPTYPISEKKYFRVP